MKIWIKKFCAWFAKAFAFIVFSLPQSFHRGLGDFIGILWFDILRIRRKLVLENIKRAFPEMSLNLRVKMGRRSLCNMGRTAIEFCYFPFLTKDNIDRYFHFEGLEKIHKAQMKNKGVCLLTCHLGAGD
ncbi:MAG: hypothetical protein KDD35_04230, partial [Bdellovibrionales bacterium]|nr:hypothetical protein [Bdellovibrionales bacterium]